MRNILSILLVVMLLSFTNNEGNNYNPDIRNNTITANQIQDSLFVLPHNLKFNVSPVEIAKEFLVADSSFKIFEDKLGKELLFVPNEHSNLQLVKAYNNVFIQTLELCYDQHRPLILTPDAIWLVISQGASIHINENYKKLEKDIFKKNKPKELLIRNDSLEYGSKHWENLISSLANETSKYTKESYYSFFVPQFSTTTQVIKTSYQINLLHSYKKAFTYVGESGCGIPYIRLTGSKADWEQIYSNLQKLNKIGLSDWREELEPIIKEFINVFDNQINSEFWGNIYKNMMNYNEFYISGWVIKFFPYLEGMTGEPTLDEEEGYFFYEKKFRENKFIKGDKYLLSTLSTNDFPSGIVDINLTWNNFFNNTSKKLNIYSGFFAIKQYTDKSLEPLISWAVGEDSAKKVSHDINIEFFPKLNDNDDYWSPYIVEKILNPAIYNPKEFSSSQKSIDFVKSKLVEALHTKFNKRDFQNDTLTFIVLINGKIDNVEFTGKIQIKEFIKTFLSNLEKEWFPALADPKEIFHLLDEKEKETILKVKVNSKVVIPLN